MVSLRLTTSMGWVGNYGQCGDMEIPAVSIRLPNIVVRATDTCMVWKLLYRKYIVKNSTKRGAVSQTTSNISKYVTNVQYSNICKIAAL